jgi:hypothetical protein
MDEETLGLLRLLLARLERISADSIWAHRASGIRGALLEAVEAIQCKQIPSSRGLNELINSAFAILNEAAREKLQ